jgi:hypothetical protein
VLSGNPGALLIGKKIDQAEHVGIGLLGQHSRQHFF